MSSTRIQHIDYVVDNELDEYLQIESLFVWNMTSSYVYQRASGWSYITTLVVVCI